MFGILKQIWRELLLKTHFKVEFIPNVVRGAFFTGEISPEGEFFYL
jgi:hypothetical protein